MLNPTDNEIIIRFEKLGLNNYEARIYLFLLRHGQGYGNEISKNTGVPSSKTYETLSKLVEKGLAHLVESKPIRYQALPLKEFLSRWESDVMNTLDYLKEKEYQIESKQQNELLWHISGKKELLSKVNEIVNSADHSILISLWPDRALEVSESLQRAHERGVKITSIQFRQISIDIGTVYRHLDSPTVENRHGTELFILADGIHGLFMYHESPRGWIGYHSSSQGIARVIGNYVRHDIYINKMIQDHYDLAVSTYGEDMSGLINIKIED